jgi:hypothetical protein
VYQKGFVKLGAGGKLKKWIFDTTTTRDLAGALWKEGSGHTENEENNNNDIDVEAPPPPLGYQEIVDGRLVLPSMKDLVADLDVILRQRNHFGIHFGNPPRSGMPPSLLSSSDSCSSGSLVVRPADRDAD